MPLTPTLKIAVLAHVPNEPTAIAELAANGLSGSRRPATGPPTGTFSQQALSLVVAY